jgi:thiosulfate/3-mercaptopyruvate sulfurtransferase
MIPPIVASEWLLDHADVVVADVRWYPDGRSGLAAYLEGHLPGAVFVDLDDSLSGAPAPAVGRHPLPDPEAFAHAMEQVGIGDRDTVVAYDDRGGIFAARLVFMLRITGHDAALLDGGLAAWPGTLERTPSAPPAGSFTAVPWPAKRLATIDETAMHPGVLLDARPAGRFRGEPDPFDPRPGHIPGARSLPCRENLDSNGRFLPTEVLRARFAEVGVEPGSAVVSYCGSGITACHNLLALEYAGLGVGRLYPGSWSQWASLGERPVSTGELPG